MFSRRFKPYIVFAGAILPTLFGTASARADQAIYTDSLQNAWQNYSWATVDFSSTATPHAGSDAIIGHAQVLGLAALEGSHIRVAIGGVRGLLVSDQAGTGEAAQAVEAEATGDIEGQDHTVAHLQAGHAGANLLHHAHVLMPEDRPRLDARTPIVHVQIAAEVILTTASVGISMREVSTCSTET